MNVLMLCGEIPYPPHGGSRIRVYNLIRALASRHQILLMAMQHDDGEREAVEALRALCRAVAVPWMEPPALRRMQSAQAWAARLAYAQALLLDGDPFAAQYFRLPAYEIQLRDMLARERFDVVHVEDTALMTVLPLALKVPIVLSIQNVETWRESRSAAAGLGASIERWKLRRFEARAFARAAVCCPTSALEGEQVKRLAPGARVHIVPNGVDTAAFVPAAAAAQGGVPALVFTGTLSYAPNAEGIIWFVRQVWSLIREQVPGARLEIVGREPPAEVAALASDQIRVCGDVPDVLPFLHAAWAAIVPLLHGGGTRLKILEAMACALPIVSTTIGAEGLDAVPERDILIADDAPAFAAQVICLLRDPARRVQLGKAGRALIERHYDWNVIAERLDAAYQMAAAARGHA